MYIALIKKKNECCHHTAVHTNCEICIQSTIFIIITTLTLVFEFYFGTL